MNYYEDYQSVDNGKLFNAKLQNVERKGIKAKNNLNYY